MSVVTKDGELLKYRNVLSGWAKRHCKLDRNYLHYFTTKFDSSPVASVIRGDILRAAPTEPGWTHHPFSFEVTQRDGTTWYFRAFDQADMDSWLMALNAGPTRRTVKLALKSQEAQVYGSCSEQIVAISDTKPTARTPSGGVQTHHHVGSTATAQAHVQPQAQAHMQQYQPRPHAQLEPALQHTQPPSYNPNWRPEEQGPVVASPHAGFTVRAAAPAAYGHVDYGQQTQSHPGAPYGQQTQPHPAAPYGQQTQPHPAAPYGQQTQPHPAAPYGQQTQPHPAAPYGQQTQPHPGAPYGQQTQPHPAVPYGQQTPPHPAAPSDGPVLATPPPSYTQATDMLPGASGSHQGYPS